MLHFKEEDGRWNANPRNFIKSKKSSKIRRLPLKFCRSFEKSCRFLG